MFARAGLGADFITVGVVAVFLSIGACLIDLANCAIRITVVVVGLAGTTLVLTFGCGLLSLGVVAVTCFLGTDLIET